MQRPAKAIEADFDSLLKDFDAEMRRLGIFPDPERGDALVREFARAGNLIFYHCFGTDCEP